jgi:hypothetical protein
MHSREKNTSNKLDVKKETTTAFATVTFLLTLAMLVPTILPQTLWSTETSIIPIQDAFAADSSESNNTRAQKIDSSIVEIFAFAQITPNDTIGRNIVLTVSNNMSKSTSNNSSAIDAKPMTGTFEGAGDGIHNAEGVAKIITLQDGNKVLRLENLKATNGPDLYVYLSTDKGASDFVNLGRLKGNVGNQNYNIPQGTDLTKYNTVLIWCKQFSVLFGSAKLQS